MKFFQILIALFILTVSASVYAMSSYFPPVFSNTPLRPEAIKLSFEQLQKAAEKKSAYQRRFQSLIDQQRFSRLLASSS